jgi:hypothetical protein
MNIYAALLGIAAMNNMTPVFSGGDHPLRDTFKSLVALDNARTVGSNLTATTTVEEITYHMYDRRFELLHTLPDKVIRIGGYLHSWKYYDKIASTIRRQFTFRDSYAKHCSRVSEGLCDQHGVGIIIFQ